MQYTSVTAVNSIFLLETGLQQFGEFLTLLLPFWHNDVTKLAYTLALFISLRVTEKQSNNISQCMTQNYVLMKEELV